MDRWHPGRFFVKPCLQLLLNHVCSENKTLETKSPEREAKDRLLGIVGDNSGLW